MSLAQLIKKQKQPSLKKEKKQEYKKSSQKTVNKFEKNKVSVEIFKRESKLENVVIESIEYSVISKDDILKQAVCEITNISKNKELINTTDDPRLGTIEKTKLCSTCEKTNEECPGHMGVINLPSNFIHPFFRVASMKVLQSVCNTCSRLLLSEKYISESGISQNTGYSRLSKIAENSKDGKVKCINGCQSNPIFKPQKAGLNETRSMSCVKKIGKKELPLTLSVEKILSIFTDISDKEVELMGFINTHPKDFIVDFIPVIPLSARPYVYREGESKDDYITTTYTDILSKKIESYQKSNDFENDKKEECYEKILYFYEHLIQNCDQTYRRSPSDICKAIQDRIVGKESLIRGNMMGKRADFTGRTVLGPQRDLSFGQIAPPKVMKEKLTIPERVTVYNYNYFLELSKEDKIDYLCPSKGVLEGRKLKYDPVKHIINIGDKIGRFSEDNDIIIFNRQPTLHKQSMLAYKCKFQDKLSVGIHLASTSGHNADFDGDEGNIHMLQTVASQVEGRLLVYTGNAIMSSKGPQPVAGLVINGPSGAYLLSKDDLVLSEETFNRGVEYVLNYTENNYIQNNMKTLEERIKKYSKTGMFTGKGLCSILFPPDFTYRYREDDKLVKINNGVFIEGRLTKAQVGGHPNSIIQSLWKNYGYQTAIDFISNAEFLFNWFINFYGFTISLESITPINKREFKKYRDEKIDALNEEVISLPVLYEDASEAEITTRENEIKQMMNNTKNTIQKNFFSEHLDMESPLQVMMKSKSKGNETQNSSSACSLFQQKVNEERPLKLLSNGKRWLSTFSIHDNSIYSRGYTKNSYLEGLNPDEFFVNAQTDRIALTDTAVKTAQTGSLQRRMTKSQQDLIVEYDGSVRNSNKDILQFNYGAGFSAVSCVYSSDTIGNSIISFIDIKELCTEINTSCGFPDFDLSTVIFEEFNKINVKYGEIESIEDFTENNNVNDIENYKELIKFDDDDIADAAEE